MTACLEKRCIALSIQRVCIVYRKVSLSAAPKKGRKKKEKYHCEGMLEILRTAETVVDVVWGFDDVLESCISVS